MINRDLYCNLLLVVLVVCVDTAPWTRIEQCGQTYLSPDGFVCFYCGPGTKKVHDCEKNYTGALCSTCRENEYQKNCNIADSCEPCQPRCKAAFTTKVKDCTLYEDIVCECQEGRYWFPETETDGVCLTHNPCEVGYGMINVGNQHRDTECEKCISGTTYSTNALFERCKPCTKCRVYREPCSTTSDAVCQIPWSGRTNSTIDPTQKTEINTALLATTVFLSVVSVSLLCLIIMMKCTRFNRFLQCSSKEDENKDEVDLEAAADPNPGLPDPPGDDREDGVEPSGSGIPKDKRPADPDPAELIHDQARPYDDLPNGIRDGHDSPEDQDDDTSNLAASSSERQQDEGEISKDELDVQPDPPIMPPNTPRGENNVISLSEGKEESTEAGEADASKPTNRGNMAKKVLDQRNEPKNDGQSMNGVEECANGVFLTKSIDRFNKLPNGTYLQSQEDMSNLHATEEGEGSMSEKWPVEADHDRLPICQPTEREVGLTDYNSRQFAHVHENQPKTVSDCVNMQTLKESKFAEQGIDSSISTQRSYDSIEDSAGYNPESVSLV